MNIFLNYEINNFTLEQSENFAMFIIINGFLTGDIHEFEIFPVVEYKIINLLVEYQLN